MYSGQWEAGAEHGRGTAKYADGDTRAEYKGEFQKGLAHGAGEYTCADGSRYEGQWKGGKLSEPPSSLQGTEEPSRSTEAPKAGPHRNPVGDKTSQPSRNQPEDKTSASSSSFARSALAEEPASSSSARAERAMRRRRRFESSEEGRERSRGRGYG